jgi:hypothetical protein
MKRTAVTIVTFAAAMCTQGALAGPLNADCTPEKAAKSAAMKGTIGVGGRCDPKETAKDTAKRTAGVEDKGPIEKRKNDDGPVKNVVK